MSQMSVAAASIHAPSVSYHALAPILIMIGVALAGGDPVGMTIRFQLCSRVPSSS